MKESEITIMECPHCKINKLEVFTSTDMTSLRETKMLKCMACGYWATTDGKNYEFQKSNFYTLEFTTVSGDKGKFVGTKDKIHKKIEKYDWIGFDDLLKENKLRMIASCIEILKYGYLEEFKINDYSKYEITVDNGLWMRIRVGIW